LVRIRLFTAPFVILVSGSNRARISEC
jgi:hypothetical protein